jgi:hypothetical protein
VIDMETEISSSEEEATSPSAQRSVFFLDFLLFGLICAGIMMMFWVFRPPSWMDDSLVPAISIFVAVVACVIWCFIWPRQKPYVRRIYFGLFLFDLLLGQHLPPSSYRVTPVEFYSHDEKAVLRGIERQGFDRKEAKEMLQHAKTICDATGEGC